MSDLIISPMEELLAEITGVLEGDLDGEDCETDVAAMVYEALLLAMDEGYVMGKKWGYVEGFQDGWEEGSDYDAT